MPDLSLAEKRVYEFMAEMYSWEIEAASDFPEPPRASEGQTLGDWVDTLQANVRSWRQQQDENSLKQQHDEICRRHCIGDPWFS